MNIEEIRRKLIEKFPNMVIRKDNIAILMNETTMAYFYIDRPSALLDDYLNA